MTTLTTAASTGWTGWHRPSPRSLWRAIVHADTEDAVFQQLLDAVAGGDKAVLPSDQDPNDRPRTMGRRRF